MLGNKPKWPNIMKVFRCAVASYSPILSPKIMSQNAGVSTEEHNDVQPVGGQNLNEVIMLDIDLNCVPPVDLAELSLAGVSEEPNNLQPTGGHSLNESFREPRMCPMAGETSSPPKKRRGCKSLDERVSLSGQCTGEKYKYFIEPGTGKKFRSMVEEVAHHLELLNSKPSRKQDQEV